jgi:hypothetical protein
MTPHEAHHLWIRFVGIDNVADTLREEFDALPCDLLETADQVTALTFVQDWLDALWEYRRSKE